MSLGSAVQVVSITDKNEFVLDEPTLKKILLDRRVKDSKVIVLSIAGTYRTGKSFMLDFFLRYLSAQRSENWIGEPDAKLEGFPWKGGADPLTAGILMWSHPFEVELSGGEKACVLLMDTQGMFDSQSSFKNSATVLALSTMLSSVQIYNIRSNINENELQFLQYSAAYGQLALTENSSVPFQELHFLVRDWQFPYQYAYGCEGGDRLLQRILKTSADQHTDLKELREHLSSCFSKIGCCLMPHPGKMVASKEKFDGRLTDIDDEFTVQVQKFVCSLLKPSSLVVKNINGTEITGKGLMQFFKTYTKTFQSNVLPEPKTLYQATVEANNLAAVEKAKDHYANKMELVCGGKKPLEPERFKQHHHGVREEAIKLFKSTPKLGGEGKACDFQERLMVQLDVLHSFYMQKNKDKRASSSGSGFQTLITLIVVIVVSYLVQALLGIAGLQTMASLLQFVMIVVLLYLIAWVYKSIPDLLLRRLFNW